MYRATDAEVVRYPILSAIVGRGVWIQLEFDFGGEQSADQTHRS